MNKQNDIKYLEEHHHITESAIGLAKLHLKNNEPTEALEALERYCKKLDEITIKYQPALAKFEGLLRRC